MTFSDSSLPKINAPKVKKIAVDKVVAHLNEKWKNKQCSYCQENHWIIADDLVELKPYRGPGIIMAGGVSYTYVQVVCGNCGNTVFLNSAISGFRPEFENAE